MCVCCNAIDLLECRYSFLDARGVGALDGLRPGSVYQQVWDGDLRDFNWHPPKGYDGTPPESAADVLTRMRQLLSVTETQYTGEVRQRHLCNASNSCNCLSEFHMVSEVQQTGSALEYGRLEDICELHDTTATAAEPQSEFMLP